MFDGKEEQQIFVCYYCDIDVFDNQTEYEKHVVQKYIGKAAYSGPADIQKFQLKLQGKP